MTDDLGTRTMRKAIWRLVPFLALLYTFNIIDRANVGFARLGMVKDVGFSNDVIDWGYGIFYVGYLLFEVPSNMLLRRFGAGRWIARISRASSRGQPSCCRSCSSMPISRTGVAAPSGAGRSRTVRS